jgi:hypothetical protein
MPQPERETVKLATINAKSGRLIDNREVVVMVIALIELMNHLVDNLQAGISLNPGSLHGCFNLLVILL